MENNLEKNLQNIKIKPSKEWQNKTLSHLQKISQENVTDPENHRNHFYINLLTNIKMKISKKVGIALATAAGIFILSGGVVFAASDATPGSPLFGLQKAIENVQRNMNSNASDKLKFEQEKLQQRIDQLKKVEQNDPKNLSSAIDEVNEQKGRVDNALSKVQDDKNVSAEDKTKAETENQTKENEQLKDLNDVKNSSNATNDDKNKLEETEHKFQNTVTPTVSPTHEVENEKENEVKPTTTVTVTPTRTTIPTTTNVENENEGEGGR